MDKQNNMKKANVCMACKCPCEMHKEHNHAEESVNGSPKKCGMCGHEHKSDGSCDCGCK